MGLPVIDELFRLNFLALFLVALFRAKTVNLAERAVVFASSADTESRYKQLQRFFREFEFNLEELASVGVSWLSVPQPWVLSLDRTNWSFGQAHCNILMLGVVHEGIAIPLMWTMLDKQENSNAQEQMNLYGRFEALYTGVKVKCLTGDREFIGKTWLTSL